MTPRRSRFVLVCTALATLALGCSTATVPSDGATPIDAAQPREGTLLTTNSSGRSGSYFIPPAGDGPRPVLVAFHGTGGTGRDMVGAFRALATARRFIVVAPDSRCLPDGNCTWEVGDHPQEVTDDYRHALAALGEVRAMPAVAMDPSQMFAAGFSGGASSAPYLATNERAFTAFAVLHGGAFPTGLGDNMVRGWFSTGDADEVRSPTHVRGQYDAVQARGFTNLVFRTFPGGHELSDAETEAVVTWWLGP